jgi:hypothetical protein
VRGGRGGQQYHHHEEEEKKEVFYRQGKKYVSNDGFELVKTK